MDPKRVAEIYQLAVDEPLVRFVEAALDRIERDAGCRCLHWQIESAGHGYREGPVYRARPGAPATTRTTRHEIDGATHRFDWLSLAGVDEESMPPLLYCLVHAWTLCRRLDRAGAGAAIEGAGHAVVDGNGRILEADEPFRALCGLDRPGADPQQLPFSFRLTDRALARGLSWRHLHFEVDARGDRYALRARPDRQSLEQLTDKEWLVLRELANGKSYRQIGEELLIAPSTASSHVYKLMDKLGFSHRQGLVEWYHAQAIRLG